MNYKIAALLLVLGSTSCASSERPKGSGGSGGVIEGDTGGKGGGRGGSVPAGTGGGPSGGSTGSGGAATGGTSGGSDAAADGPAGTSKDGPAMSGGDLWAKCGPEAYKADVSAADFCARYISVCKASVTA